MAVEQSVASARASVMTYDDFQRKWIHSGSSSGLSKVHLYQHMQHNTFRVVGRKLQDHEVVINCPLVKGLKYNQATPTFHQWRNNQQVYGLNFSSKEDADNFALAVSQALEILNNPPPPPPPHAHSNGAIMPPQQPQGYGVTQPIYQTIEEKQPQHVHGMDGYYQQPQPGSGMSLNRRGSQGTSLNHSASVPNAVALVPPTPPSAPPPAPPPMPHAGGGGMQPTNHHRSNSTPMAPPPVAPPPPTANGPSGGGPPPPPPPPPGPLLDSNSGGANDGGLASALQSVRLKRRDNSDGDMDGRAGSGSSGSSSARERGPSYGTLGRAPTSGDLMDEMAKTLARRRAQAEGRSDGDSTSQGKPSIFSKSMKKFPDVLFFGAGTRSGAPSSSSSPQLQRRKSQGGTSEGGFSVSDRGGSDRTDNDRSSGYGRTSGGSSNSSGIADMDALKDMLLREIRREMNTLKVEILDSIRAELGSASGRR